MLSATECDDAIAEAEAYAAANGGWLTDRHVSYPTTDIEISNLPRLDRLWEDRVFPRVADEFSRALALPEGSVVTPLDVFLVKYDYDGQRELAVHRDNGLLTFSMLLNEPDDFGDGGTYFEHGGRVYRPSRGVGVLHSALVRHAGYPISRGTRYVLVGFCGLASPKLPPGFDGWRFGNPAWFVSSRVVRDDQILKRIWPTEEGGASSGEEGAEGEGEYPPLRGSEEMLASGEISEEEYAELVGGEGDEVYPTLEDMLASGEISEEDLRDLASGGAGVEISGAVVDASGAGVEVSEAEVEVSEAVQASAEAELSPVPTADDGAANAAKGDGDKPWYRQQHDMATKAREGGTLLQRTPLAEEGVWFEMWRTGNEYMALLVYGADMSLAAEAEVVASTTFRSGPLSPEMSTILRRRLPATSVAGRLRDRAAIWRRPRLAGMVHVYVAPAWRGAARGEELSRLAMIRLRAQGFSHCLTLADDRGSGKLRAWYRDLGFTVMEEFGDTAMVARARG